MNGIRYCLTGCTDRDGDTKRRRQTEGRSQLCRRCEDDLHTWLTTIPDNYALLPTFVEHGVVETNPDSKATKAAEAQAPMRLDIIDLLDTRHGLKWNGTTPAHDRRGVAGTLQVHVDRLREERPLTQPHDDTNITAACTLLDRHRLWLAEQDWVTYLYDDLKATNRQLSDAVGDYRRPPVGKCHITNDQDERCNGGLYANTYGGVRCGRCGTTWDPNHLRQLGLAQNDDTRQETA